MSSVPAEIGNLSNLTSLGLDSNKLSSVPAEISNLSNLTSLPLGSNQLSSVPAEIINLSNLDRLELDYNRITFNDPELLIFLNNKGRDWATTQTIAPTGLSTHYTPARSENSIQLSWTPITFQNKGGYYEISIATDEAFTVHGITTDKSSNDYTISGLDEDTDYNIRIRTYTPAHNGKYPDPEIAWDDQPNELWSEYSETISAKTLRIKDDYESDNQCPDATAINISGLPQEHNFHAAVDEDWVKFDATEGETYRIEVDIPPGSRADVNMGIHAQCGTLPDDSWNESLSNAWPPYIVSAQIKTTGLRSAMNEFSRVIEAEVRDNIKVRDVQAVIYLPSYQPPTDGLELVQEPEQVIVLQSRGDDRYAVTYPGFTERGIYRIHVHAVDEDGLEAAPIVLEVNTGSMVYLPAIRR